MANPYAPPSAPVSDPSPVGELDYAGFWIRFLANFIDTIILVLIIVPVLWWAYGDEILLGKGASSSSGFVNFMLQYVFPAVATIVFWHTKQATPGKMLLSLRIVDARTGGKMSVGQEIGRYFAYIPSIVVFFLGFFWIGWDSRKQGWHDKLAGTLVVRGR